MRDDTISFSSIYQAEDSSRLAWASSTFSPAFAFVLEFQSSLPGIVFSTMITISRPGILQG
jgi:hypothetical protein